MSKVDWSVAPIWAKSYGLIGVSRMPVWFDDYRYQYLHDGRMHEFDDGCTFSVSALSETEERPKQPQAWSGEGHPPVGTVCEFNRYDGAWVRCEIKLFDADGICIKCSGYLGSLFAKNCSLLTFGIGTVRFRAIKTDEQIAQEKRESAIRDVMDIAQVDCRVTAARLVDAGFKREVV